MLTDHVWRAVRASPLKYCDLLVELMGNAPGRESRPSVLGTVRLYHGTPIWSFVSVSVPFGVDLFLADGNDHGHLGIYVGDFDFPIFLLAFPSAGHISMVATFRIRRAELNIRRTSNGPMPNGVVCHRLTRPWRNGDGSARQQEPVLFDDLTELWEAARGTA